MRGLLVDVDANIQQVYSSVGKIQGSKQIAVLSTFCLCQHFLGGDLVKVFIFIFMENTAVVEESEAY